MTSTPKRQPGAPAGRTAANISSARRRRGLSSYDLSAELTKIGHPIQASGITRIERGERQVPVDDLTAVAVVLNCSPNRLLMPAMYSPDSVEDVVPVAGNVRANTVDMWRWAAGEQPLVRRGEDGEPLATPSPLETATFVVDNLPHHYARPAGSRPGGMAYDLNMGADDPYQVVGTVLKAAIVSGMNIAELRAYFERVMTTLQMSMVSPSGQD